MSVSDHGLVPGQVPEEQFELLLAGRNIRGVGLINALRDHLVGGLPRSQALSRHGVNKSQFSRRLAALFEESARAKRLSRFYGEG